jgi:hypothetical protein
MLRNIITFYPAGYAEHINALFGQRRFSILLQELRVFERA